MRKRRRRISVDYVSPAEIVSIRAPARCTLRMVFAAANCLSHPLRRVPRGHAPPPMANGGGWHEPGTAAHGQQGTYGEDEASVCVEATKTGKSCDAGGARVVRVRVTIACETSVAKSVRRRGRSAVGRRARKYVGESLSPKRR